MSEEVKGASGSPDSADSVGSLENEGTNAASGGSQSKEGTVARDTYLKTLGELKSIKSKFTDMQSQFEEMQQGKLSAEGNKDQLIETLRTQVEKEKTEKQRLAGNFIERSLKAQFEAEAMRQGIKKPQIIDRLVNYGDYVQSVDTETFTADATDIKSTVEQVKEEYPELFGKSSPKINNKIEAGNGGVIENKKIDFSKLTKEQANRMAEDIDRQEGKRENHILK